MTSAGKAAGTSQHMDDVAQTEKMAKRDRISNNMKRQLTDILKDISPERREAVRAALASCTRGHAVETMRLMKGGVSGALIYKVNTGRQRFALRIEPERIAL